MHLKSIFFNLERMFQRQTEFLKSFVFLLFNLPCLQKPMPYPFKEMSDMVKNKNFKTLEHETSKQNSFFFVHVNFIA